MHASYITGESSNQIDIKFQNYILNHNRVQSKNMIGSDIRVLQFSLLNYDLGLRNLKTYLL